MTVPPKFEAMRSSSFDERPIGDSSDSDGRPGGNGIAWIVRSTFRPDPPDRADDVLRCGSVVACRANIFALDRADSFGLDANAAALAAALGGPADLNPLCVLFLLERLVEGEK